MLHHTRSTREAFLKLVPLLRPGGTIAIWVYSTELRLYLGGEILRPLTSRLPRGLLMSLAWLARPMYHVHRLPTVGVVTQTLIPTSMNPDPLWRWLDTFDWYSPRYQWKHTYEEVEEWFKDAGLVRVERGPFPVSVRGTRSPLPAQLSTREEVPGANQLA